MHNQRLYESLVIEVYSHCKLLLPLLRVPCWFLYCNTRIKNWRQMSRVWTHNLRSWFSVSLSQVPMVPWGPCFLLIWDSVSIPTMPAMFLSPWVSFRVKLLNCLQAGKVRHEFGKNCAIDKYFWDTRKKNCAIVTSLVYAKDREGGVW